ncbi:MAG: antirestriction protein ArdA [Oscillibacter sp.]|nr:antirestriction protein ArdA [Oscillibacter sp.]
MLEAYVTNLGKYNEGALVGEYLKLPASTEDVQALLKRIGVDGVRYEEIFITDYETDIPGLYDCLGEYESIDELNYLASLLEELDTGDMERFAAAVDYGEHTGSVKELINLAQNLDCYDFYPGVRDEEELGRIYIEDMDTLAVPEHLRNYIDYAAYGRDIAMEESGHFTGDGYVLYTGGFTESYSGREDIPEECRVFAYPKLNIRETMAAYKDVIDRSAEKMERGRSTASHEER